MRKLRNMIIIGGASRNVGKTELVCGLIRRFSFERDIVSLKISGINPGNGPVHGQHGPPPDKFDLMRETGREGIKDSSKMLLAGAGRAYYLRTRDEYLPEAMDHFFSIEGQDAVIICESISLRKIITPGLFVIVRSDSEESVKRSLGEVLHLVDLTIVSDGMAFAPDPGIISLDERGWHMVR